MSIALCSSIALTLPAVRSGATASPADTAQLVIRTRAGVHPRVRRTLLAEQGSEEIATIEALGASVVRVPRRRAGSIVRALRRSGYFKSVELDGHARAALLPNDPDFASEWGLSKVGAPAAWDVTLGSSAVTVAIVDSGIDPRHPDLQAQLVPGYDFVNNDADASDDNGHGTRMAGVVAAEGFNAVGISGVAPRCKLMPVKVLGTDGAGNYSTIASGITYAVDHGARVINLSLAGSTPSAALQSAIDYATARGAIVVASSGNYGTGDPTYPAACTNVVGVGASDESDAVPSFSNHGSWVSLVAPGSNILTTNWTGAGGPAYIGSTGTSPAAAFVSGAFALLLAVHPELSPASAVSWVTAAAHDLGGDGWDPYAGWGRLDIAAAIGSRSVPTPTQAPNRVPTPTPPTVPSAVPSTVPSTPGQDRGAPTVSILSPASKSLLSGNVTVDVTATDDVGVARVTLTVDNTIIATDTAPPFSFVWNTSTISAGKHALRARAYDAVGNVKVSKAVRVTITAGTGLSIKHARLDASSNASGATMAVSGIASLPNGVSLQSVSSLSIALRSAKGAIFAAELHPDATVGAARGSLQLSASAADATGAFVAVTLQQQQKQPTYSLSVSGSGLSLANADTVMSLTLNVDGATLSQAAPFRSSKNSLVFP